MARFSLIPREEKFFEDFAAMAVELRAGAATLEEMIAGEAPLLSKADEIKAVEHRCDQLTHDLLRRLNRTFVTPLDREDIYTLAKSLDDVMDAIDAAAGFLRLYRIDHVRPESRELAHIISRCVEQLHGAMQTLENRAGLMEKVVEINRLENEADVVHSRALGRLFDEDRDPFLVIKWKDVFSHLEEATDRCEDVANVLEGVVAKYA